MFIDFAKIRIKSGDGGKGCESFLRRTDKKVVPNGGDGGDGGDVIIRADRNESSLQFYSFRPFLEAKKGEGGSSNQKAGKKGNNLILTVPCGTSIYNQDRHYLIRDLINHDDEVIAVKGGKGGAGNDRVRQATPGKPGEELEIFLDYTLVADIFLIGTPNSGKSMLLHAITGSKVKVEDYPFSTRTPQLGTYQTERYDRLTLCELPSLERGSFQGRGLGNQFLKHLKRTKLIFYVLDPASEFAMDLDEEKAILDSEISHFNEEFDSIPRFYVVNKTDLMNEPKKSRKKLFGANTYYVSSTTGEGISELMKGAAKLIDNQKKNSNKEF